MQRSSSIFFSAVWILALLLLSPTPSTAVSFVRVADEDLADQAPVIVEVEVLEVDGSSMQEPPMTDYVMHVESVIRGESIAGPMTVRVAGGLTSNGFELRVSGAPRFVAGQRALLFLRPADDGSYRILHFMLGVFHLVERDDRQFALRHLSDALEIEPPGRQTPQSGPRDFERFSAWLQDRASGIERPADYFVESPELATELEKFTIIMEDGLRIRWTTFDSGGSEAFRRHTSGQPGLAGGGASEFQAALAAWTNDPNTPIRYVNVGTTSSTTALASCDNINSIIFDDPNDVLDDPPFNCGNMSGVVAAANQCIFLGITHDFNGITYREIAEADIVTNRSAGCFLSSSSSAEEVFSHELGHTLGLGHSSDSQAQMFANVHGDGRGADLRADDLAGIRFLYGAPLTAPAAPTGLSANAISNNRIDLAWTDNASNETSFDIERRIGNGSFQQIASRGTNTRSYQDNTASSGTTYTYRVRARNAAGPSAYAVSDPVETPGENTPSNLVATALSGSAIRLTWQDNANNENGYRLEGKISSAAAFSVLAELPANSETFDAEDLLGGTTYTFRVRATGGSGDSSYSNQASATTFCVPGLTTLCLNNGRFKAEVNWRTPEPDSRVGPGTDLGLVSADSGLLWFFNPTNWEMLIKVLDACSFSDHFWVFAAATTDVEYDLVVTDTFTGDTRTYLNEQGVASPAVTDTAAFATCEVAPPAGWQAPPNARTTHVATGSTVASATALGSVSATGHTVTTSTVPEKQGTCVGSTTRLCLNENRFEVEIEWENRDGDTGFGQMDPFQSSDSGLMWFFSPNNVELLVKVLDGCSTNGFVWVFAAATTDVKYTLRVTDTQTGIMRQYFNPLDNAADAITDTGAFDACP